MLSMELCVVVFFRVNPRACAFLFQISLVDLAGSERAAKTGATPEQLKVTMSAV